MRYRLNDYSVPTSFGHRDVLVRGYVQEVVISCGTEVIARHPRSYEREDFVFDPLHYLALIEQKINALDQAAPLASWELPEQFATLRRLLEARMGKQGKREFVQVLRQQYRRHLGPWLARHRNNRCLTFDAPGLDLNTSSVEMWWKRKTTTKRCHCPNRYGGCIT